MKGLDTNQRLTLFAPQLASMGYEFACRYLRRGGGGFSVEEAKALTDAGLALVSVFEYRSTDPAYFTAANAQKDGQASIAHADKIGQPTSSAIYLAVDCDIVKATVPRVLDYFRIAGRYVRDAGWAVGIYGDADACLAVTEASDDDGDLADHIWKTNARAWTRETFDDWDINQTSMPFTVVPGLQIDADEAKGFEQAGMWRAA